MSKINAIRFVNLNYNHQSMRVDDELFQLSGESTLLALRNGGGKSVLVQMMMAPFMNKRHRDLKDRLFKSYFTTNKPTFILVEWALDHGAGYLLTGMMVRKQQGIAEDIQAEPLEIINFVHHYKQPNSYDIKNFPFVEQTATSKKLKSFSTTKQLFEKLKKENTSLFNYYDMTQSQQARKYFTYLEEYHIHYKEWENIVKKINLKESGLSELFLQAKNVGGLVEKWFLDSIHGKLNKEDDKIKRFTENISKYIKQYKANQEKINRKAIILMFKEETQAIFNSATTYEGILLEKEAIENQLANLIEAVNETLNEITEEKIQTQEAIESINEALETLAYEKLCIKIYHYLDEKSKIEQQMATIVNAREEVEIQKESSSREVSIQECSKLYLRLKRASEELQGLENDLCVLQEKSKDLAPERMAIGYTLKCFYEEASKEQAVRQEKIEADIEVNRLQKEAYHKTKSVYQKDLSQCESKLGHAKAQLERYDQEEASYNKRYATQLARNIMGQYQEDFLYLQDKQLRDQLDETSKVLSLCKHTKDQEEESYNQATRDKENSVARVNALEVEMRHQQDKLAEFEEEKKIRLELIKYVEIEDNQLFNTDNIKKAFDDKIANLKLQKMQDDLQLHKLEEIYKQHKEGQVLKLPQGLEEHLEQLGIHPVYGMEWLKKNKVENYHQLLPYALIMSEKEITTLKHTPFKMYTPAPIPIVRREDLEKSSGQGQMYEASEVRFVVAFDERLLDEKQLEIMLLKERQTITKLKEQIKHREEAIKYNEEKKARITYQRLTKEGYDKLKQAIEALYNEHQQALKEGDDARERLQRGEKSIREVTNELKGHEQSMQQLQHQQQALDTLKKAYESYLEYQTTYAKLKEKRERLLANQLTLEEEENQRQSQYDDLKDAYRYSQETLKNLRAQLALYEVYKTGEKIERDLEDLKARYESITKNISADEASLTARIQKAGESYKEVEEELLTRQASYDLKEVQYREVHYDKWRVHQLEIDIKTCEQKIKSLHQEEKEIGIKLGGYENKLDAHKKELEANYHKPLKDKVELVDRNFLDEMRQQQEKKEHMQKRYAALESEEKKYSIAQTTLDPYKDFIITNKVQMQLSSDTIQSTISEHLRDHNHCREKEVKAQRVLDRILSELVKKDDYQDPYYLRPLQTLEKIADQPSNVIASLKATLDAYDSLMVKLEADIALIEKEKQSVVNGLSQYVYEIHEHMGKIDKNSTVTIREKPIKMLKVELPNWEEHEAIYENRLVDLLERLTKEGLEKLEQNENIEELLTKVVTTKQLYHEVVGIGNVQVKLYKIEEDREYQITWDEVAKNSGGEGFLSAFVVLSSLLSYMRRDDTEFFMDKESGKVLVMDNPFAQTNAAHLLKPLMEMAKKRNTQLICLSGLGGESIYSRFDNIYVLNLVPSRLSDQVAYLKSEHQKGEERVEELVGVQIQTEEVEQMELLF